jgi:hypothetical protein
VLVITVLLMAFIAPLVFIAVSQRSEQRRGKADNDNKERKEQLPFDDRNLRR